VAQNGPHSLTGFVGLRVGLVLAQGLGMSAKPAGSADLPVDLRVRTLDSDRRVMVLTFRLGSLSVLTAAELDVARLAHAGLSNDAIATLRGTSTHTVAAQMVRVLRKLRVASRLALATIPEVRV
jgi:DNA-binding NarL/FixJ family response regulator